MSVVLGCTGGCDFGFPIGLDTTSDLELSTLERLDTADFECHLSDRLEMVI